MNLSLLISKPSTLRTAWLESLALTVLLPASGYAVNAADPFYLNYRFPWLILAPLLISLRYGFLFGISSAGLLIASFLLGIYREWLIVNDFPAEIIVGMLLITMISGEFHSIWQQKIRPLQRQYEHLKIRMHEFSRAYHVLKGSHSQLEQQAANHTKSMRTSLLELQNKILTLAKNDGAPLDGIAEPILDLFSEYGSIQTASVYAVSQNQKLKPTALANLGNPPNLWPTNPLLIEALKTGHVTSLQTHDETIDHEVLVVIPLIDIFKKVWGVVVVNEMSMFALQDNTLDLLSLLGGHIGDLIKRRSEANLQNKDVWLAFEYELRRVIEEVRSFNITAAVLVTIVNNTATSDVYMTRFGAELRGLDKVWGIKDSFGRQIIINLLPLTDETGLKDFLARLDLVHAVDKRVKTHLAKDCIYQSVNSEVTIYNWILTDQHTPEKILSKISQVCRLDASDNSNEDYSYANISA